MLIRASDLTHLASFVIRFIQPMDYSEFTAWKSRQDRGEDADEATSEQQEATAVETAAATLESTVSSTQPEAETPAESSGEPKYPASFMELCQMLAEGKPIPGKHLLVSLSHEDCRLTLLNRPRNPRDPKQDKRRDTERGERSPAEEALGKVDGLIYLALSQTRLMEICWVGES